MAKKSIVILDGGRRLPRADILHNNKAPGLFTRFTTTQLGGLAIKAALQHTAIDPKLIGGFIVSTEKVRYDSSLATSIKKLKKEFEENLYIREF